MKIPMLDLKREYEYMKEDIDAAIGKCLNHQQWILGPEVKELEQKVADYIGVKHCIGVSSGKSFCIQDAQKCPDTRRPCLRRGFGRQAKY